MGNKMIQNFLLLAMIFDLSEFFISAAYSS